MITHLHSVRSRPMLLAVLRGSMRVPTSKIERGIEGLLMEAVQMGWLPDMNLSVPSSSSLVLLEFPNFTGISCCPPSGCPSSSAYCKNLKENSQFLSFKSVAWHCLETVSCECDQAQDSKMANRNLLAGIESSCLHDVHWLYHPRKCQHYQDRFHLQNVGFVLVLFFLVQDG